MLAQRHGDGISSIRPVLGQYLWNGFLVPTLQQSQQSHEVIIVSWLKVYFLHQILGVFLFIVHAQPFGNIVDPRPLHPSPIPLPLHHPLALLIIFDAHQLLIAHHRRNLPELRNIHHLCLQMLLDEFLQVTPPYLFVLFSNEGWALLSVEGVPGERLEVEVPEEGLMLWCIVLLHNSYLFKISIVNLAKQRWLFCIYL